MPFRKVIAIALSSRTLSRTTQLFIASFTSLRTQNFISRSKGFSLEEHLNRIYCSFHFYEINFHSSLNMMLSQDGERANVGKSNVYRKLPAQSFLSSAATCSPTLLLSGFCTYDQHLCEPRPFPTQTGCAYFAH